MGTLARETATNARRINSRYEAGSPSGDGSAVRGSLEQAVADAQLALAGPRHFLHGENLRRFTAQREHHFAFAPTAPDAHAHHFAGRAPAQPALDVARQVRAVETHDRVAFANANARGCAGKIEIADQSRPRGIAPDGEA